MHETFNRVKFVVTLKEDPEVCLHKIRYTPVTNRVVTQLGIRQERITNSFDKFVKEPIAP